MTARVPRSTLFPYTTLFRSGEFEVFADSTAEIPLQTAILMLARFAKVPVVMDPRLKSGGERYIGTNVIALPSITNITVRSEEHTSELQSQSNLVCRLLLDEK